MNEDRFTMPRRAVVLAGGVGSRLNPYTTVIPKPLLPVGDRAILDILVRQLAAADFTDLTFAVGYLSYLIEAIFGDGSKHGVVIDYHQEEYPRGTVGALAEIGRLDEPFLMINGDILTTLDYRALYRSHIESENVLTIATHARTICTEYGVLRLADGRGCSAPVIGYEEKPELPFTVSMGVYILDPRIVAYIPGEGRFDLPDLVHSLISAGESVGSYLYDGYWLDIGRHEDYQRAIADFGKLEAALVGPTPASQNGRAAKRNGRTPGRDGATVGAAIASYNRKGSSPNGKTTGNGKAPSPNGRTRRRVVSPPAPPAPPAGPALARQGSYADTEGS